MRLMKTYCLALDLKDDPQLIEEYKNYHRPEHIWPEVLEVIKADGVLSEEIYLVGTRMVMVLRTTDDFSFETKGENIRSNLQMCAWEELMGKYQQAIPGAKPGEKWVMMEKIFEV